MGAMAKKLHSSRGMSMVIALVFFLICALTGAVIINAVAANTAKTLSRQAEQRDYLAVSSAAELLKSQLEGTEYYEDIVKTIRHVTSVNETADDGTTTTRTEITYTTEEVAPVSNPTKGNLLTKTYALKENSYTIWSHNADLVDVTATVKLDSNSNATIVLQSSEHPEQYAMTLHFTCDSTSGSGSLDPNTTYTYARLTWHDGTITKGGAVS